MLPIQAEHKPLFTAAATKVSDLAHAKYSALRHAWAAAGAKLLQIMRGSKGDQAAFAADLAALAAQLTDDGTHIPDAYTYAYMAEFDEAITRTRRDSPITKMLQIDTAKAHPAAKVALQLV